MELKELISELSRPQAYPYPVAKVGILQTHISVVFLAGDFVYKVKKPVSLGFLDFSTLDLRQHFCLEEVHLNRRLAPDVYLGVVPITSHQGHFQFEGEGEPVEWAVKMIRLPEKCTFQRRLLSGALPLAVVESLARKLAGFHAQAETNNEIASYGRFDIVAKNARENIEQIRSHIGKTISANVHERLSDLLEKTLQENKNLIEARASQGRTRDTHGDLHLDHIYWFPDRPPPRDLTIVDCIEFNKRFRYADPVSDMAFLVMDFLFHGRPDLASAFSAAYFSASGDNQGLPLLPFYVSYRAAVRGKVEGMKLDEEEVPEDLKCKAQERSRAYWLLALAQLEEPGRRPCLILVGGLPGTGKSTLARALASTDSFHSIRSDEVRKELAGLDKTQKGTAAIYSPEFSNQTYDVCLRRAKDLLFQGERVVVDATFREVEKRRQFIDFARAYRLPVVFFQCQAGEEIVRTRLGKRKGDASDADWGVYQQLAREWEVGGEEFDPYTKLIDTGETPELILSHALGQLKKLGIQE